MSLRRGRGDHGLLRGARGGPLLLHDLGSAVAGAAGRIWACLVGFRRGQLKVSAGPLRASWKLAVAFARKLKGFPHYLSLYYCPCFFETPTLELRKPSR